MLTRLAQAGACVLVAAMAMVNVAEARVGVGAGFGTATYEYEDVDSSSAKKFYLAYEMDESPAYFELALTDTGEADITSFPGVTLNVSGMQLGAGYRLVLNQETGSNFFGKVGFYDTDTEIKGQGGSAKDGNSGLYLGFGGDWMFGPSFGLRFDIEGLLGVKDFADDKNVTIMTVGPLFKFGGPDAK